MTSTHRFGAWLTTATRQYAYAIGAAVLYAAITIKYFWFTSEPFVAALSGAYGAVSVTLPSFVAVAIGLQQFAPQGFGARRSRGVALKGAPKLSPFSIPLLWQLLGALAAVGTVLAAVWGYGALQHVQGYDQAAAQCHAADIQAQLDAANRDLAIAHAAENQANRKTIELADREAVLNQRIKDYEDELSGDSAHHVCILSDADARRLSGLFR